MQNRMALVMGIHGGNSMFGGGRELSITLDQVGRHGRKATKEQPSFLLSTKKNVQKATTPFPCSSSSIARS